MVLVEKTLNGFLYSVKHPPTVRHAYLVNAIGTLTAPVVYAQLNDKISLLSKSSDTNETLSDLYILKRDCAWVKKMFMGVSGIDVSVTPAVHMKTPTPKPKPKPTQKLGLKIKKNTKKTTPKTPKKNTAVKNNRNVTLKNDLKIEFYFNYVKWISKDE